MNSGSSRSLSAPVRLIDKAATSRDARPGCGINAAFETFFGFCPMQDAMSGLLTQWF